MGKPLLVESVDKFLDGVEASGLLADNVLAKVREAHAAANDPITIARSLIKDQTLTKWQAGQLLYGYTALTIAKYKLLDQLAATDIGREYLAEHATMGRRVVLQVLSRRCTSKPEVVQQFLAEARQAAALDHRNLVHLYDVDQDNDRHYLVLENVEGRRLPELISAEGPPPIDKVVDYFWQITEGLAHAHGKQVLHGELKPQNILVDSQGTAKISGIGVSSLSGGGGGDDGEDETGGQEYTAPERRAGGAADAQADLYALGGVLAFLLTGEPPSGKTAAQLQEARSDLPAELAELCVQLLASDKRQRPASARAALATLESWLQAKKAEGKSGKRSRPSDSKPSDSKASDAKPADSKPLAGSAKERGAGDQGSASDKPTPADKGGKGRKQPPVARPIASEPARPAAKKGQPAMAVAESDAESSQADVETVVEDRSEFAFAIQTKRSGKPKAVPAPAPPAKKPAAKAPAAVEEPADEEGDEAEAVAEAESAPAQTRKKSQVPWLLIGLGAGGGVLALGTAAAIGLWLIFGRGGPEPREIAANLPAAAATPVETPAEGNGEDANPGDANPMLEGDANPTLPGSEDNPPLPATETTNPPATTPMPMDPGAAEPGATATTTPPMEPEKPAPDDKPPADKPPEPEPKPEPKPAPKVNPFLAWKDKFATLPPLDGKDTPDASLEPVELGPIKVGMGQCLIRLIGGEMAIRGGKQRFSMMNANNDTAPNDWEIRLETGEGSGTFPVIAKLKLENDKLFFQWTEEVKNAAHVNASILCNCALSMSAGSADKPHVVALRKPLGIAPLSLDLNKGRGDVKWQIDAAPDPKNVFIEFTKVEGPAKSSFEPEMIDAEKGSGYVWMGDDPKLMPLGAKLEGKLTTRTLTVTASAIVRLEGEPQPQGYTKKKVQDGIGLADRARSEINRILNGMPKPARGGRPDPAVVQQQSLLNQQLEKVNAAQKQLDAVLNVANKLSGPVVIHARVYYRADEKTQVDLLRTDLPVEEKADK